MVFTGIDGKKYYEIGLGRFLDGWIKEGEEREDVKRRMTDFVMKYWNGNIDDVTAFEAMYENTLRQIDDVRKFYKKRDDVWRVEALTWLRKLVRKRLNEIRKKGIPSEYDILKKIRDNRRKEAVLC